MLKTARHLTDQQLFTRIDAAASADRINTVELLVCLGEIDARGTYRQRACSSMWVYCTERLKMSADVASVRLRAARMVRQHPRLLADIVSGDHHVSGLSLLFKVMTTDDFPRLLEEARGKSKRDIEAIVARSTGPVRVRDSIKALGVAPRRRPADVGRLRGAEASVPKLAQSRLDGSKTDESRAEGSKVSGSKVGGSKADGSKVDGSKVDGSKADESKTDGSQAGGSKALGLVSGGTALQRGLFDSPSASGREQTSGPVEEQSYRVAFTASARTHRKLREARDLLRHAVPGGSWMRFSIGRSRC